MCAALNGKYLVTGGSGYFGRCLVRHLLENGAKEIVVFDLRISSALADMQDTRIRVVSGDVRNYESVRDAMNGLENGTVFHVASYGMSGLQMMQSKMTEQINVGGTDNVIKACLEVGMSQLVYTSTLNVVFADNPISGGDETLPYAPLDSHPDMYSRTKTIAEQRILKADGERWPALDNCGLRRFAQQQFTAKERHLPRIVDMMKKGLYFFSFGDKRMKMDWVYGDNLASGHFLAAKGLAEKPEQVGGQVFFISDESPVNQFDFLRPLCVGLGYTPPSLHLSLSLMLFIALLAELFFALFSKCFTFAPFLSRAEVYQVGVEHYFSTAKARRLLGYRALTPPHTAMQRVVAWHRKQGDARADQPWFHLSQPLMRAILLCVAVLGVGLLLGRAAWAHIAAL